MNKRDGRPGEWLRSGRVRALILAALVVSLTLGAAFVVVSELRPSAAEAIEHPANPVTDDQSRAQVLEAAKQIVTLAGLRTTSAGYLPMSCKDRKDPPYQGAIYLTFALPPDVAADKYFPAIATTLARHGWIEGGQPANRTDGRMFSKDAVTAIIYRDSDDPRVGIVRLYGECRNMNDHRHDGWTDVAGQLAGRR
jgi:hypothetical protein